MNVVERDTTTEVTHTVLGPKMNVVERDMTTEVTLTVLVVEVEVFLHLLTQTVPQGLTGDLIPLTTVVMVGAR